MATADDSTASVPRVYLCLECDAPIPDLVIATECEECGHPIGDDRYLIDSVSTELLEEIRADADGCINCGADTDSVFCSTQCSERWFSTYTDAYTR